MTPRRRAQTVGLSVALCCALALVGCRNTAANRRASTDDEPARVVLSEPSESRVSTSTEAAKPETAGHLVLGKPDSEIETVSAEAVADQPADAATAAPLEPRIYGPEVAGPVSYPIDLPSVLELANGRNPQAAFARERINEALAQVEKANALWLPSIRGGTNYNKHEGAIQNVAGNVFNTSRSAFWTGFGANAQGAASPTVPGLWANFHMSDAIFQPRIAEQVAGSRRSGAQAVVNELMRDTAWAYLDLLAAEQELAIARETLANTETLANLTELYARTGEGTVADDDRLQAERSLRRNDVVRGEEAVRVTSARLAQLLHIDPTYPLAPQEPTVIPIELVSADVPAGELVAQGLSNRPELAESKYLVGEAVERMKRERYAPLVPSVILGMSYGGFGGGFGGNISNFNNRMDADAIAYWEVRNLGLGEQAARGETRSRVEQARYRELAALDRVAREVVETQVQVQARRKQIEIARDGITSALNSHNRNLQRIENGKGLPIEVLQSIQALNQARRDYLRAVVDYNRAQFGLHWALGAPVSQAP
jgi:outer membrane protein TolC